MALEILSQLLEQSPAQHSTASVREVLKILKINILISKDLKILISMLVLCV